MDQPGLGRVRQARPAARFDRTPSRIRRPAPAIGEHTREILAEFGDDEAAIAATLAALAREAESGRN
jgi:crotonobetainyl-CoA:carnitine CoA-transferase CaiB-like acyl-CoA transferase